MAQRRFGPTQGAGVAIIELEGEKPISAGALGWAGYPGILERGPVGELIVCPNQATFERKCGGYIEDSLLPDCCFDYFDLAAGAGGLLLVRVTDGNEVQSELPLYCRKTTQTMMGKLKAKNGGRWGGKLNRLTGEMTVPATELTETTFDTGLTMLKDEWKGAYLEFDEIVNKRYLVISNTVAGVVTVVSDATMSTDYGAGTDNTWYLYHETGEKYLSAEIKDGEENPDSEFGIYVYLNGDLVRSYPNLHTDPANSRYWENIINNDTLNEYVEAEDLWTGGHDASVRPANHYGVIDTGGVTETTLTAVIHEFTPNTVGDGDGTCALGTTTDDHVAQTITCTFTGAGTYDVSSDKFGALATGETVGVETDVGNKWVPPFTLTDGASAWEAADVATLVYKPFVADSLEGGNLYPDKPNAKREYYRIESNTHKIITVVAGSDLTVSGADGDQFLVVAPLVFEGGKDGIADLVDADYINQAWSTVNSPFNQTRDKGYGLVKFATPNINSSAVQQAGKAYAEAKNHQYRYEVTDSIADEVSADEFVNDTLGRSDFAVVTFPSYGYVADPEANGEGKLKLVPLTGMIHGREARIAVDYDGYHKAEAGVEATLPKLLKLTTGETILNEEYLNPKGIGIIKKKKGNFVLWGDRTLAVDPNWKWKHQREQMSRYEQDLIESFDWIVYMINDKETQKPALAALKSYFLPEWTKRALRGDTFDEAAIMKVDEEINTDVTRAAGDMFAKVSLKLADTVERFIIQIGKQGVFESVE